MKLGISSYTYPWACGLCDVVPAQRLAALGLLQRARTLGVRVVQLVDVLDLATLTEGQVEAIATQAAADNITIELGVRTMSRATLDAQIALAGWLQAPLLRVVLRDENGPLRPDLALALLRAAQPALERHGVVLGVETHESMRADQLRIIMDAVNSRRVGVVFDAANLLGVPESPLGALEVLLPHVVNIHAKDARIRRAGRSQGFVIDGVPAGAGSLALEGLIDLVRAYPANKVIPEVNVILEHWMPACATLEQSLDQEQRWAEVSVRHLRQFVRD